MFKALPLPVFLQKDKDKFWNKVKITSNQDLCWEYISSAKRVCPSFKLRSRSFSAIRVAYSIFYQVDLSEKEVYHTCSNVNCVNPKHLEAKISRSSEGYENPEKNISFEEGTKKMQPLRIKDINRFFEYINKDSNDKGCWEWQGGVKDKNKLYGMFSAKSVSYSAHRVSYFIHNKKDPVGLHVLHTCDNPKCVNPAHLFLGTNNDNVQDKIKKGRARYSSGWNKGIGNPHIRQWRNHIAVLTEEQYKEVFHQYVVENIPLRHIAKKYNTSHGVISKAVKSMGAVVAIKTELTPSQVLEIRSKYNKKIGNGGILAKEYNIGRKTILDIANKVTWKHL